MTTAKTQHKRHGIVALSCVAFVSVMIGAAYAAVPLYDWFCRVTGFGGTPSVASVQVAEGLVPGEREVTIRFDANVGPGLPWRFEPVEPTKTVRVGEVHQVMYRITNPSGQDTVGTSVYNVTPFQGGGYFTKIQCFCFQAQPLAAGETREVPVIFYVDPRFDEDPDATGVNVITLSYTFYPFRNAEGAAPSG